MAYSSVTVVNWIREYSALHGKKEGISAGNCEAEEDRLKYQTDMNLKQEKLVTRAARPSL